MDGAGRRSSMSTPGNLSRRPQPSFAGSSRTVVNEAIARGRRRTTLARRTSTSSSDSFEFRARVPARTLSSAEEGSGGQGRPRRDYGGHDGVVAELIQYGLHHGTARPRSGSGSGGGGKAMLRKMSASSLYEQGEKAEDEGEKTRKMSYRDRSHSIREMRRTSIVDHVEGQFAILTNYILVNGTTVHRLCLQAEVHRASR